MSEINGKVTAPGGAPKVFDGSKFYAEGLNDDLRVFTRVFLFYFVEAYPERVKFNLSEIETGLRQMLNQKILPEEVSASNSPIAKEFKRAAQFLDKTFIESPDIKNTFLTNALTALNGGKQYLLQWADSLKSRMWPHIQKTKTYENYVKEHIADGANLQTGKKTKRRKSKKTEVLRKLLGPEVKTNGKRAGTAAEEIWEEGKDRIFKSDTRASRSRVRKFTTPRAETPAVKAPVKVRVRRVKLGG